MYPQGILNDLAHAKRDLRVRLACRREESATVAAHVFRPLVWLDRVVAWVRQFSMVTKLMSVPAGVALAGALNPKARRLRQVVRWLPFVTSIFRSL
jgi:hypothetical protein